MTVEIEEELSVGVTALNGLLLKQMIIEGANELNRNKQLVDSLNVFPVPDGDTGTNMSLTVLAAAKETEKSNSLKVSDIAMLAASGALRGARGNSGVITSQLFRGFAKGLEGLDEAGTKELAAAIKQGVKTAYKAVMKPKEGTILSVARACAESAAKAAEETDDVAVFLKRVIEGAGAMLLETTEMLPVLKQAGVVDAGGKGLLCVLEGAYRQMNGSTAPVLLAADTQPPKEYAALASVDNESITFGYCTEFFIQVNNVEESQLQSLKGFLSTIGDSIVCVADEEIVKIHVHTDHPGLAIEKALTIGSLNGLKIDNMREQHTNKINFGNEGKASDLQSADLQSADLQSADLQTADLQTAEQPPKNIGFVSVSAGSGLKEIFMNLGVDYVIEGGQTMNPSTEDILNAIAKVNAKSVVILPNNKNIILAAEQAAKLSEDKKVYVIASTSVPEGIAALFHYEPDGDEESLLAMEEAMEGVVTASLTYAVRDTTLAGKEIKEGDILGMVGGNIEVVNKDVTTAAKELMSHTITDDTEVVSVYYGSDVAEEDAQAFIEEMKMAYPHVELELLWGGQPLYYYIISAE